MSYCRFAGGNDAYCYADVNGKFYIITKGNRREFVEKSLIAFYNRLVSLQEEGLRIPNYVFKRIRAEIKTQEK